MKKLSNWFYIYIVLSIINLYLIVTYLLTGPISWWRIGFGILGSIVWGVYATEQYKKDTAKIKLKKSKR